MSVMSSNVDNRSMIRRGLLKNGVILLHENARPQTAQLTQEILRKLDWEVLPHPPCIHLHIYLFGPLKNGPRGMKFGCNEEVKIHVQMWLRQQPKELYTWGIRKLEERWQKVY